MQEENIQSSIVHMLVKNLQ